MPVTETGLALAARMEWQNDSIAWFEGFILDSRAYLFDYAGAFVTQDGGKVADWHAAFLDDDVLGQLG